MGRRARKLLARMLVLYMSGHGAHDWAARNVLRSPMVRKPYVGAQIAAALTALLMQADRG